MELLDRIEDQVASTGLPLFAITLAAVPCPDTPIILTLHWHGFVRETLAEVEDAEPVAYTPIPSSALQLNERWNDLVAIDLAAMEAGWELGAWDVQREERPGCVRPGAPPTEALECLQAFGSYPYGVNGQSAVVSEAPDADDLIALAARQGYLLWLFRPVSGGIWADFARDATLSLNGRREPPCPILPIPANCRKNRRTVYRFGMPPHTSHTH